MNQKTRKALNITSYVVIGLIFLVALMVLMLAFTGRNEGEVPKLFGASVLTVQSDSMKRTYEGDSEDGIANDINFNRGDLIILKRLNAEQKKQLKIGDVVTYWDIPKKIFNTHKIIKVTQLGERVNYTTRGVGLDAGGVQIPQDGSVSDREISSADVLGVYKGRMAGMGKIVDFFKGKVGFGLLIVLPLFAFLLYRIFIVIKLLIAINKEKKGGTTLSEMEAMQAEIARLKAELKGPQEKPDAENET